MLKIYHNTRCKKSRAGLQYLIDNNVKHEVIEYLKNPISQDDLNRIFMKLNIKNPEEMIRKQEAYYKENLKGKNFNYDEWVKIILENPKLLNRPIIEAKTKAVWGDPPENIKAVL